MNTETADPSHRQAVTFVRELEYLLEGARRRLARADLTEFDRRSAEHEVDDLEFRIAKLRRTFRLVGS